MKYLIYRNKLEVGMQFELIMDDSDTSEHERPKIRSLRFAKRKTADAAKRFLMAIISGTFEHIETASETSLNEGSQAVIKSQLRVTHTFKELLSHSGALIWPSRCFPGNLLLKKHTLISVTAVDIFFF